jgi:hypothetical protein
MAGVELERVRAVFLLEEVLNQVACGDVWERFDLGHLDTELRRALVEELYVEVMQWLAMYEEGDSGDEPEAGV